MDIAQRIVGLGTDSSDEDIREIILYFANNDIEVELISSLTQSLARSGQVLPTRAKDARPRSDIASTGGPTSLSTLVCPLFLNAMGLSVVKLGVPGRPAGGIDVMAQVPGYQLELSLTQVEQILLQSGFAHFVANENFAPLDARMFSLRQQMDAQSAPPLVIASLLSKKLALNLDSVGIDVRVASHGNFGVNWAHARENAKMLIKVSRRLSIDANCFLTDASVPYQPYIGRMEALLALQLIFQNKTDFRLKRHVDLCTAMASRIARENARDVSNSRLLDCFEENLNAQGTSREAFDDVANSVLSKHSSEIRARASGYIRIDILRIRTVIVKMQMYFKTSDNPFPDPLGIILHTDTGDWVTEGQILASVRIDSSDKVVQISELEEAFIITDQLDSLPSYEWVGE